MEGFSVKLDADEMDWEAEQFSDEDKKVKERVLTPRTPSMELRRSLVTTRAQREGRLAVEQMVDWCHRSWGNRGGDQLAAPFHVDFSALVELQLLVIEGSGVQRRRGAPHMAVVKVFLP